MFGLWNGGVGGVGDSSKRRMVEWNADIFGIQKVLNMQLKNCFIQHVDVDYEGEGWLQPPPIYVLDYRRIILYVLGLNCWIGVDKLNPTDSFEFGNAI